MAHCFANAPYVGARTIAAFLAASVLPANAGIHPGFWLQDGSPRSRG